MVSWNKTAMPTLCRQQNTGRTRTRPVLLLILAVATLLPATPDSAAPRGDTLLQAGLRAFHAGQYAQAQTRLQQALITSRRIGSRTTTAKILIALADVDNALDQSRPAEEAAQQALQIAQRRGSRKLESAARRAHGESLLGLNQPGQAAAELTRARNIARAVHAPREEAEALAALADADNALSQYSAASAAGRQGLAIAEAIKAPALAARLHLLLGNSTFLQGQYRSANAQYGLALNLAQTAPDPQMAADALLSLGNGYNSLSDFGRAVGFYAQALPRERRLQSQDAVGAAVGGLAGAYLSLGEYPQAIQAYRQALAQERAAHDADGETAFLSGLGRAFRYEGRLQNAVGCYQKAIAIARRIPDNAALGMALSNLGEAYWLLHKYDAADNAFRQALAITAKTGDQETEQWAMVNWGNVYLNRGLPDRAAALYQQALAVTRQTGVLRAQGYCYARLMLAAQAQSRPRLAVFYGKLAINTYQRIRRGLRGLGRGPQQSFIASKEAAYRRLAEILIDSGRLPEAQQTLDLLKTQEYADFLRGGAADGGQADLNPQESDLERQYAQIAQQVTALGRQKQDLLDRQQQASLSDADQAQFAKINDALTAANAHLNAFESGLADAFRAGPPENESLNERLKAISDASGLQNDLNDLHTQGRDAVVLQTIVAPDRYAVIVTTAQSQKVEQYPIPKAELDRDIAAFQSALRNPDVDPRGPARKLYDILFAPIAADLEQAQGSSGTLTLMWSLDGELRYVPIAALYDGSHYLVERYDNEVFTMGSHTGFRQDRRSVWEGLGLGVSQPPAASGLEPLPAVPDELHGVIKDASHVGGIVPGEVLLNDDFTPTTMDRALDTRRYGLVHIASHFALKPGSPDDSFLLLGGGARLSLTQLANAPQMFQRVDLLTLSACDTATGGQAADGKEVDSLGTVAQKQGAGAVLASLWPVSDASTELLMREFYRCHQSQPTVTKAAALRQAQLALLRGTLAAPAETRRGRGTAVVGAPASNLPPFPTDPKIPYAHPCYWAPFVLMGDWQ